MDVVNMLGALGRETLASAEPADALPLPVADLAHLIALQLKAGGPLDRRDVQELLLTDS